MDAAFVRRKDLRAERAGAVAARSLAVDLGDRLSRGAVAGITAGLAFLLANMAYATTQADLPAVAPLIDISTIFNLEDKPTPTPENVAVGLITHLGLSAAFGIGFAMAAIRMRSLKSLALGGVGFGVLLYVVNFQILGRTVFPWFQEGPDQLFELLAHAGFGLLLVPFFLSRRFLSSS